MSRPLLTILIAWGIGLGGWILFQQNQPVSQQSASINDAWDSQLVSPNNFIPTSNTKPTEKSPSTPSPSQTIITATPAQNTLPTNTATTTPRPSLIVTVPPTSTPTATPTPSVTPVPIATSLPTSTPTNQPTTTPTPNQSTLININTANATELEKITGIGPAYAKNIIDYRNTNGPFHKIEDVVKVKGIGPKTFEKMKNEITV